MKKSLGNKLDKAITKSYTELYQQMDCIRFNADQLAKGDYADEQGWEDIMHDITEAYDKYKNLKKLIEFLEDTEEGF